MDRPASSSLAAYREEIADIPGSANHGGGLHGELLCVRLLDVVVSHAGVGPAEQGHHLELGRTRFRNPLGCGLSQTVAVLLHPRLAQIV